MLNVLVVAENPYGKFVPVLVIPAGPYPVIDWAANLLYTITPVDPGNITPLYPLFSIDNAFEYPTILDTDPS